MDTENEHTLVRRTICKCRQPAQTPEERFKASLTPTSCELNGTCNQDDPDLQAALAKKQKKEFPVVVTEDMINNESDETLRESLIRKARDNPVAPRAPSQEEIDSMADPDLKQALIKKRERLQS